MAFNLKTHTKSCLMLATTGKKANDLAHTLGVAALTHALETGDIRPTDMVVKAMIDGRLRAEGFRVWVQTFAPILWNGDGEIKLIPKDNPRFKAFDVEKASGNPFWMLEAARERTIATLSPAVLRALIERFVNTVDEANEAGEVLDKDGNVTKKIDGNVEDMKTYARRVKAAAELADPKSEVVTQYRLIKGEAQDLAEVATKVAA